MNELLKLVNIVCFFFLVCVPRRSVSATFVAVCTESWTIRELEQWQLLFKANPEFRFQIITLSAQNSVVKDFPNVRVTAVEQYPASAESPTDPWTTSANAFTECNRQIEALEKKSGTRIDFVFNAGSGLSFYRAFKLDRVVSTLLNGSVEGPQSSSQNTVTTCDVITRSCPADHGVAQRGYFWTRNTAVNSSLRRKEFEKDLSQEERLNVAVEVLEQRMMLETGIKVCALPVDLFPAFAMRRSANRRQLCIPREEVEAGCYPAGMEAFVQDHVCGGIGDSPQRSLQDSSPSEGTLQQAADSGTAVTAPAATTEGSGEPAMRGIGGSDASTGPSARRRPYSAAAVEESLLVRLKEMELRARALEYKLKDTVRGISKSQAALVHENKALRHELVSTKKEMSDTASRLASASSQLANMRSAYDRQATQLELCQLRLSRVDRRQQKHQPQSPSPSDHSQPEHQHQHEHVQETQEGSQGQQRAPPKQEEQRGDGAKVASPEQPGKLHQSKRVGDGSWFTWF